MLSKRTKLIFGLLSICILTSLVSSTLAASYHHEDYIKGITWPNPPNWITHFKLTAKLDVTTESGDEGPIITSYSKSSVFWTEKEWVWFLLLSKWEFVNKEETITITRWWNGDKIAVKYQVSGMVREIRNHNHYVYLSVWVKLWADDNPSHGHSWWDDHIGYDYVGVPF